MFTNVNKQRRRQPAAAAPPVPGLVRNVVFFQVKTNLLLS